MDLALARVPARPPRLGVLSKGDVFQESAALVEKKQLDEPGLREEQGQGQGFLRNTARPSEAPPRRALRRRSAFKAAFSDRDGIGGCAVGRLSPNAILNVGIVIPAHNEEGSVAQVVRRCLGSSSPQDRTRVVVGDNESTDATAERAREAGAEVAAASPRGYGHACLAAVQRLGDWPDALLFLDADGSSRPEEMELLLAPIREGVADLTLGHRPPDSPMTPPQRWGTRLAAFLIRLRWRRRFHDIGPYRAIRADAYRRLEMRDKTWGWTVEMQILAVVQGLRVKEVPTRWEKRLAGVSKISGTVSGVARAGARILWTIGKYWFR